MVIDIVNSPAYTSKRDGYIKRRAELIDDARNTTKTAEERNKSKMLLFALDYSLIRHMENYVKKTLLNLFVIFELMTKILWIMYLMLLN